MINKIYSDLVPSNFEYFKKNRVTAQLLPFFSIAV